ncbi:hypothetical protein AgCh_026276 [Apium graveolens]
MAQPKPTNSSSDDENEPYTEDVAYEMPWKTMESIEYHYELLVRDMSIIMDPNFDPDFGGIIDEAEDDEQSVDSESENDKGDGNSSE